MRRVLAEPWVLWALAALLLVAIPAWMLWPEDQVAPSPAVGTPQNIAIVEGQSLEILAERPLFNAERKPLAPVDPNAPETPAGEVAPPPPAVPRLVGVVTRRKGKAVAIVRGADGSDRTLARGESADGWQLVAIGADWARFTLGEQQQTVKMEFGGTTGATDAGTEQASAASEGSG